MSASPFSTLVQGEVKMAAPVPAQRKPRDASTAAAQNGAAAQPMLHPVAIAYTDGTSDRIGNIMGPRVLIALEAEGFDIAEDEGRARLAAAHGGGVGQQLYIAWIALGRPGKSYDAWMGTVEGFEPLSPVPFGSAVRLGK